VRSTVAEIALSAPKRDGLLDLHAYLIDVFWWILVRCSTCWTGPIRRGMRSRLLKNITYSTRDFWTEVAFADRGDLTKDRWGPISDGNRTRRAPLVAKSGLSRVPEEPVPE